MNTKIKKIPLLTNYYLSLVVIILTIALFLPVRWSIMAYGHIEPESIYFIKPDVAGVISEVLVQAGETISAGQSLAKIQDPKIKIDNAANRAEHEKAKMNLYYVRKMYAKGYVAEQEVKEAELNYNLESTKLTQSNNYDLKAPIAGTLLATDELGLRVGDNIEPGAIIATIANLERMKIKVRVPEYNIAKIQVGNEARIYVNAFPSMLYKTLKGRVTVIHPQAQVDNTGNYFVVIITLNQNYLLYGQSKFILRPGMAGYAKITYERSSFFHHAIKQSFASFSR